jgi:hypothetical protein
MDWTRSRGARSRFRYSAIAAYRSAEISDQAPLFSIYICVSSSISIAMSRTVQARVVLATQHASQIPPARRISSIARRRLPHRPISPPLKGGPRSVSTAIIEPDAPPIRRDPAEELKNCLQFMENDVGGDQFWADRLREAISDLRPRKPRVSSESEDSGCQYHADHSLW